MKKLALALITLAAAATSQAVDLKSVFEQAVANDPQLAAELAGARADGQSQALAGVRVLPTVVIFAEQGTTTNEIGSNETDTDKTVYGIKVTQPLVAPSAWYEYGAAMAASDSAGIELIKAEQSLVVRVSEAYFNVLRANAGLASAKANESAVKRQDRKSVV